MEMPSDEYFGWIEWIEEDWSRPDKYCYYMAQVAYEIHLLRLSWTGGEPSSLEEFLLQFKNRLDEAKEISEEDKRKLEEAESKRLADQNKANWLIASGAKSKKTLEHIKKQKVKAPIPTKNPPKRKGKK